MELTDIFLYFLACSIFGIWLAVQKTFFVIPSEKYNKPVVRAFFTVPCSVGMIGCVSGLLIALTFLYAPFVPFVTRLFGNHAYLLSPIICSLFAVLLYKKYMIPGSLPHEVSETFSDYALYAFRPRFTVAPTVRSKNDLAIVMADPFIEHPQTDDLVFDLKILEAYEMAYSIDGFILVSE